MLRHRALEWRTAVPGRFAPGAPREEERVGVSGRSAEPLRMDSDCVFRDGA